MTSLSWAQVTRDGTLSTTVNTSDNLRFTITGGSRSGSNLFHSFHKFSVPEGGAAIFNNAVDVKNIFSRVTGGSMSEIRGTIQTNANASLFLLNPSGIIFGPNAQLNIGGSFVATTANQINFADGDSFDVDTSRPQSLLTVSVPIGLQFGETPGSITNRSVTQDGPLFVGLQVNPGRTLALVGGNIFFDSGYVNAPGARIELGSVAENSLVHLTSIAEGWAFGYEGVQNFQNIQLFQGASIDTSSENSGNILLQGKEISITNGSAISSFNYGDEQGGKIFLKASNSLKVANNSSLSTYTFSNGASGDILIDTSQLIVRDLSFIDASGQTGPGGDLIVNASQSVEIGLLSQLATVKILGSADAGNVKLTTGRLILRDGGQIQTSTLFSAGNGGDQEIRASESIEVSGTAIRNTGSVAASGLFTTIRQNPTGSGGNISVITKRLVVRDEGTISAAAIDGSLGQAGNVIIKANSVSLDKAGSIQASTISANGGNIDLQSNDSLVLRRGSLISATAGGAGNGGNIKINAGVVAAIPTEDSDIIATADRGNGGRIQINTQGIFGIEPRQELSSLSDINASSDLGVDGTIDIQTLTFDPSQGLVPLPAVPVDPSRLIAQNCSVREGATARKLSEFVVTGRGGVPASPYEALSSDAVLTNWAEPDQSSQLKQGSQAAEPTPGDSATIKPSSEIVEAQGWVKTPDGQVMLVAQAPAASPHGSGLAQPVCPGS